MDEVDCHGMTALEWGGTLVREKMRFTDLMLPAVTLSLSLSSPSLLGVNCNPVCMCDQSQVWPFGYRHASAEGRRHGRCTPIVKVVVSGQSRYVFVCLRMHVHVQMCMRVQMFDIAFECAHTYVDPFVFVYVLASIHQVDPPTSDSGIPTLDDDDTG